MNKGQWVVLGFVGLALATSAAYISIQLNASPTDDVTEPAVPVSAPVAAPTTTPAEKQVSPPTPAASTAIGKDAARAIAIGVLKGDPYGRTDAEVRANFTSETLVEEDGHRQWVFAIRIAPTPDLPEGIAGEMRVDAQSGQWEPRGLPFLD